MDRLGIAKLPDGANRKRYITCLTQQGPFCFTNFQTVARQTGRAARRENLAQQKAVEKPRALLDDTRSAEMKLETAAHAKQAEALRLTGLTPAQKQAEAVVKLFLAADKKAVKNPSKAEKQLAKCNKFLFV